MKIYSNRVWIEENFVPATLELENGVIQSIVKEKSDEALDYGDHRIIPGLIDIHTHGYKGKGAADGDYEFIKEWAEYYPQEGVTMFLPGINVTTEEMIKKSLAAVADAMDSQPKGAIIYGTFLQAPFMDHSYCGTYSKFLLKAPTVEHLKEYIRCSRNTIKTISLAVEHDKDHETLKYCVANNIKVCLGFSQVSYEEACQAIDEGASNIVHCFNCMKQMQSREPNLPAAALTRKDVFCEVMTDGVHVHPSIMQLVGEVKGKDRLISVTDSSPLKALKPGIYQAEGGPTRVCDDGVARLLNGQIAGSLKPMILNIRDMQEIGHLPLATAVNAATINPARLLGIDDHVGLIKESYAANLAVFDEEYKIIQTYVNGKAML